jgi:hypothetical protein
MTQTCQTFGLADPSLTKSQTLRYLILLQPSGYSSTLVQSTPSVTETKSPKIDTPSQHSERNALISTCKRRMSLLRNKGSKRSGTILHAVPETTACTTALHDDKRDTTAAAYQNVSSRSQIASASNASPTLTHNDPSGWTRNKSGSPISLGQPFQFEELKSVLSTISLPRKPGEVTTQRRHQSQRYRSSSLAEFASVHSQPCRSSKVPASTSQQLPSKATMYTMCHLHLRVARL